MQKTIFISHGYILRIYFTLSRDHTPPRGMVFFFEGGPSKFISAPPPSIAPPPQKMAPPQCPPSKRAKFLTTGAPPSNFPKCPPPQNDSPSKCPPPLNAPPSKKTPCLGVGFWGSKCRGRGRDPDLGSKFFYERLTMGIFPSVLQTS